MVIKVGIVGLSKTGSWADAAHVKPLQALMDDYQLTALSTSRAESASEGAETYGVKGYHGSTKDIASDSNVDLVVVAVKVPAHKDAILPVLEAGKDVFCEWPLGLDAVEAEEIAEKAKKVGVRTIVGLQARQSLVFKKAKELIHNGEIGRILSTSIIGNGGAWGPETDGRNEYLADVKNGATMLTIPAMHTLDGVMSVLGELTEVSARIANGRKETIVKESNKTIPLTSPDQLIISGELDSGAVLSFHYRGGAAHGQQGGTPFRWEIEGEKGMIVVTGPVGHAQLAPLKLELNGKEVEIPTDDLGSVGRGYQAFANKDTAGYVDFDHAVRRHKLIEKILVSAQEGRVMKVYK